MKKYNPDITILVVDDNKFALSQLVKILKGQKYKIIEAVGGEDALKKFKKHDVHIIVTDYNMPDMNGIDLSKKILSIKPKMPIILVSALDDKAMLSESIHIGIKQYIAKPIDVFQLLNTVKSIAKSIHLENEISHKLKQLEILSNASLDIIIVIDESGEIVFANNLFFRSIEKDIKNSTNLLKMLKAEKNDSLIDYIQVGANEENTPKFYKIKIFKDRIFKISIGQWLSDGEKQKVIILHDITNEIDSIRNEQLFRNVFDHSVEGILITNKNNEIIECNNAFQYITGYSLDEIKGKKPSILKSGRHDDSFYKTMWDDINSKGCWSGKLFNRRKDGGVYYEYLTIFAIYDDTCNIANYAAIFSDINYKKGNDELSKMAYFDMLTNLPNRYYFNEHLRKCTSRASRQGTNVAVVYFDLDEFKKVNDLHGHQTGDQLLCEVAQRLQTSIRDMDLAARMGGDEFAIILSDLADDVELEHKARVVAEKIISIFDQPFDCLGKALHTSASVGISVYPRDALSINDLLKFADISMYNSKKQGKGNYTFYNEEINKQLTNELHIENLLKNCDMDLEFDLYLQPQVNLFSNEIIGAEALIRWNSPTEGFVSPAQFISISENAGVIYKIDKWVIKKAAELIKKLRNADFYYPISVNLSAKSLDSKDNMNEIIEILDSSFLGGRLIIEITESTLVTDFEKLNIFTDFILKKNIYLAIDDFGTGYSSLGYLKKINANSIKIDKTFIDEITEDIEIKVITEAIIKMAHTLGMKTVAEGVEQQEQVNILKDLGCNTYQGYLCSKPIPVDQFICFVNEWKETFTKGSRL